jgi:hypothetical protein
MLHKEYAMKTNSSTKSWMSKFLPFRACFSDSTIDGKSVNQSQTTSFSIESCATARSSPNLNTTRTSSTDDSRPSSRVSNNEVGASSFLPANTSQVDAAPITISVENKPKQILTSEEAIAIFNNKEIFEQLEFCHKQALLHRITRIQDFKKLPKNIQNALLNENDNNFPTESENRITKRKTINYLEHYLKETDVLLQHLNENPLYKTPLEDAVRLIEIQIKFKQEMQILLARSEDILRLLK